MLQKTCLGNRFWRFKSLAHFPSLLSFATSELWYILLTILWKHFHTSPLYFNRSSPCSLLAVKMEPITRCPFLWRPYPSICIPFTTGNCRSSWLKPPNSPQQAVPCCLFKYKLLSILTSYSYINILFSNGEFHQQTRGFFSPMLIK